MSLFRLSLMGATLRTAGRCALQHGTCARPSLEARLFAPREAGTALPADALLLRSYASASHTPRWSASSSTAPDVRVATTSRVRPLNPHAELAKIVAATPSPPTNVVVQYVWGYVYTPVGDPEAIRRELYRALGGIAAGGRIYVYKNGINIQLAATPEKVQACQDAIRHVGAGVFKSAALYAGDAVQPEDAKGQLFSKLHIRVRPLLREGLDGSYSDSLEPLIASINHLPPDQWHAKLSQAIDKSDPTVSGNKPIILDIRNGFEYELGGFKGATPLLVDTFRESFSELDRQLGLQPVPSAAAASSTKQTQAADHPLALASTVGVVAAAQALPKAVAADAERLVPRPATPIDKNQELFIYCTGGIRCLKVGLANCLCFNELGKSCTRVPVLPLLSSHVLSTSPL